jgi:aspartate/methionine/tyrosine aminotransferase
MSVVHGAAQAMETGREDRVPANEAMQISTKIANIPEALSIYINQLVYEQKRRGRDIAVLSLGEAFFDIPMFDFSKLDFVRGYHYSDSQGVPELRERIAQFYRTEYGATVEPKTEILITAGSKPVICFAMQAALNAGDETLIHEPGWLSYQEQARIADAVPTFIPHYVKVDDFHEYFTRKTRMLIINNPNNPAGRVYTKEELTSLYVQCRPRNIYIMVDEAYSDFAPRGSFHSMTEVVPDKDGIIVVNSLSKNMGMSGWRVGYVITSNALLRQILKINQHVITCAPTILQQYMARYFDDVTAITLPQVRRIVEKRDRIEALMNELGLVRMQGSSTFYFMVSIEEFPASALEFALHCLFTHQIAVVPGSAYGESCARFVRVGIGTESEERIHDALLILRDVIRMKNYDPEPVRSKMKSEGFHRFEETHV